MTGRTCFAKGQLVSQAHWIPTNLAEYNSTGSIVPAIGCNRLWCSGCETWVRVIEGVYLRPQTSPDLASLHDATSPLEFGSLQKG